MKRLVRCAWCICSAASLPALAQTPAEDVSRLLEEVRQAQHGAAGSQPESGATATVDFGPRFRALVEQYPGQPEVIPVLVALVQQDTSPESADAKWALERLTRDHAAQPEIAPALRDLLYSATPPTETACAALYDAVVARNPQREAQSRALYQKGALIAQFAQGPDRAARHAGAIELFRRVTKDYAGLPIAPRADSYIFELEHLQVGMPAPELAATDLAGSELRLSDLKGKVVVLAFWGYW